MACGRIGAAERNSLAIGYISMLAFPVCRRAAGAGHAGTHCGAAEAVWRF